MAVKLIKNFCETHCFHECQCGNNANYAGRKKMTHKYMIGELLDAETTRSDETALAVMKHLEKTGKYEENSMYHRYYGETLTRHGKIDSAMAHYKKSVAIDPDNYETWDFMGQEYERRQDYTQELECYNKALACKLRENDETFKLCQGYFEYKKAWCLKQLKQFSDARELFKSFTWTPEHYKCQNSAQFEQFLEYIDLLINLDKISSAQKKLRKIQWNQSPLAMNSVLAESAENMIKFCHLKSACKSAFSTIAGNLLDTSDAEKMEDSLEDLVKEWLLSQDFPCQSVVTCLDTFGSQHKIIDIVQSALAQASNTNNAYVRHIDETEQQNNNNNNNSSSSSSNVEYGIDHKNFESKQKEVMDCLKTCWDIARGFGLANRQIIQEVVTNDENKEKCSEQNMQKSAENKCDEIEDFDVNLKEQNSILKQKIKLASDWIDHNCLPSWKSRRDLLNIEEIETSKDKNCKFCGSKELYQLKCAINDCYGRNYSFKLNENKYSNLIRMKVPEVIEAFFKHEKEFNQVPNIFVGNAWIPREQAYQTKVLVHYERVPELQGQKGIFANTDMARHTVLGQYIGMLQTPVETEILFDRTFEEMNHNAYALDMEFCNINIEQIISQHNRKLENLWSLESLEPARKRRKIVKGLGSNDSNISAHSDTACTLNYRSLFYNKRNEFLVCDVEAMNNNNNILKYMNDCRKNINKAKMTSDDQKHQNCMFVCGSLDGFPTGLMVTTKAVKKGEQLLVDYGEKYIGAFQSRDAFYRQTRAKQDWWKTNVKRDLPFL